MMVRLRSGRDPFWDDGQGARRSRSRRTRIGSAAFAMSIIACGLTAAAWVRLVLPFFGGTPLG